MTATEPTTDRSLTRWMVVALVVFGGTIAWAGRFTAGYLLVPVACRTGAWVEHVATLAFALLALAALVLSLRWGRRDGDGAVRFALWFGAALNAFMLGAILLEGSAALFVDPCMKGSIP